MKQMNCEHNQFCWKDLHTIISIKFIIRDTSNSTMRRSADQVLVLSFLFWKRNEEVRETLPLDYPQTETQTERNSTKDLHFLLSYNSLNVNLKWCTLYVNEIEEFCRTSLQNTLKAVWQHLSFIWWQFYICDPLLEPYLSCVLILK